MVGTLTAEAGWLYCTQLPSENVEINLTSGTAIYGSIQPNPRRYLSLREFICKWDNRGTKYDWSDMMHTRSCTLCPVHMNCCSYCHPVLLQQPQQLRWEIQVTTKTSILYTSVNGGFIIADAEAIHRKPRHSPCRRPGQSRQVLHVPVWTQALSELESRHGSRKTFCLGVTLAIVFGLCCTEIYFSSLPNHLLFESYSFLPKQLSLSHQGLSRLSTRWATWKLAKCAH